VAGALLSITLNPFVFSAVDPLAQWLERRALRRSGLPLAPIAPEVPVTTHVVLIGAGRVGYPVLRELRHQGVSYTAIEASEDITARLTAEGFTIMHGDGTSLGMLRAAGLEHATLVLVASPDAFTARTVLARAHQLNPGVEVILRTHSDAERLFLEEMGAARALFAERELAVSMTREVLGRVAPDADTSAAIQRIREEGVAGAAA
jgi:CPA2 family monovalent cation:H+ antiporter-2